MIGHFPTPYPDELLYSLCARYSERVQYSTDRAVNSELFGARYTKASVDITCNLKYLVSNLPTGHYHTVDSLIDNHTLLPFYIPFIPQERVAHVREGMAGSNGSTVRASLGLVLSTISPPIWLRFCPLCAESDREVFGEFYWHRLHQVSGVEVCPTHNIFLENGKALTRDFYNPYLYISAEQALQPTSPRILNLSDCSHQTLIALAKDVAWLLNQQNLVPGYRSLHLGFTKLLAGKGMTTYRLIKRRDILLEKFRSLYSNELLRTLQCDFDEQKRHNWLYRIINNLNQHKAHHPLRYLLLIHFIGYTAESFLKMCLDLSPKVSSRDKPFGNGPWPCLNPVCKYFRKPRIKDYKLTNIKRPNSHLGIFSCSCGFAYSRRNSDSSESNQYRISRVRLYGHVWESHLRSYWKVLNLSLEKIGEKLGVNIMTVKYHATRLGLRFPRKGTYHGISHQNPTLRRRLQKAQAEAVRKRKYYRKQLLLALKTYPMVNRTSLRLKIPHTGVYDWLYFHDRDWLEAHLPPPRRTGRPIHQVDNDSHDFELSKVVRESAIRLRSADGRPYRVTNHAIGRDINKVRTLNCSKTMAKLPLTADALKESIETRIEFAIRRIQWAAGCFRRENVCPSWTQLPHRAALGTDIWYVPEVKAIIDSLWLSLQEPKTKSEVKAA